MSTLVAPEIEAGSACLRTSDGGARQPDADLWCSYAAVRCLAWLGQQPADADAVAAFLLSRQNADGAFAWQRGLPSDMWATYYCTQGLRDLGRAIPATDRLADWLGELRTRAGGFAMTSGQSADIWATYYACRTHAEVLGAPVPQLERLTEWLKATQTDAGGLSWAPGRRDADVRACYYGALAWQAAAAGERRSPWHSAALASWLSGQQASDGGFGFAADATSCAWAAFRAVRALNALGEQPRDVAALRRWLVSRRLDTGGYERWPGYGQADVWACFSVVGALATLGHELAPEQHDALARFVQGCQLSHSGFTYRDPRAAGDSLATAAALILARERGADVGSLTAWLRAAQLPFEDGVMYMPGRGSEVRCTLWAAAALQATGRSLDSARLAAWLDDLQNVDGGFGYWQGRGSDLVSTVSALEIAHVAGLPLRITLDTDAVLSFLDACATGEAYRPSPGAAPTLGATAQAARALDLLGHRDGAFAIGEGLRRWASPLGGFSAVPRAIPDLVSTYQAVLTQQVLGLTVDRLGLGRFLTKVAAGPGFAWSPLGSAPAGPLADCLGTLLRATVVGPETHVLRLNL